ncbi:hypothetical protein ACIL2R_004440, partial [Vibrio vulnificus]
ITKHLRVIRNAWRFRFAQVWPSVAHTLMRRYATKQKSSLSLFLALSGHRFFGVGNSALPAQVLESLRP